jgi:hypothetical protein
MSFISPPSQYGSVITMGAPCGSDGGAMYDPPAHDPSRVPTGKKCFLTTSPPVIIGDTAMSVKDGFSHINWVFHTNGDCACCPDKYAIPGVVV